MSVQPSQGRIYVSDGRSTWEDVANFKAIQGGDSHLEWKRAEVERFGGLTLFAEEQGQEYEFHFPNALCGYSGTGPLGTVEILREAGFEIDEADVFDNQDVVFIKL